MRNPPPEVIASWPAPNYIDPETRGQSLLIVNIILLVLCFIVLGGRLWARFMILRAPGLDDVLITIAMIPTVGVTVAVILAVNKYGWNLHIWDVPISSLIPSRKSSWVAQFFFIPGSCLTKISILLFYRRVTTGTVHKTYLYVIYGTIAFIATYAVAFELVLFLGCRPLHAYWDAILPTYTESFACYDEGLAVPASGIINVITDLAVVALPYHVVWGMQMPIRQKVSLSAVFGVGLLVCIAGIIRTIYVWKVTNETYDETWVGYTMWLWTAVETDLAIICACAPALKPFFRRYLGSSRNGTSVINSRARATASGYSNMDNSRSKDNHVTVTTELTILEQRIGEPTADDESARGGYTSSIGSTKIIKESV